MLVIRRLFGTGTNCIAPSGLPLLLCLFPGLAPWAFLSRPCGASFAPETSLAAVFPKYGRGRLAPGNLSFVIGHLSFSAPGGSEFRLQPARVQFSLKPELQTSHKRVRRAPAVVRHLWYHAWQSQER